jgi:hypothetical protein
MTASLKATHPVKDPNQREKGTHLNLWASGKPLSAGVRIDGKLSVVIPQPHEARGNRPCTFTLPPTILESHKYEN